MKKTNFGGEPILDSRLITATFEYPYNAKIVECNGYTQVYIYQNKRLKKQEDLELVKKESFIKGTYKIKNIDALENKAEVKKEPSNKIEQRNIMRSKLDCQRIAKCNAEYWKTFWTLTIAENVTDIAEANRLLHCFITKIKRVDKDFMYICIPEFQKRGAVHYHLLTNIDINDKRFIYDQEINSKYKHIKYWNYGFTKIDIVKGDVKKIVGYISKYMTKDIDNRLFNKKRFHKSMNLKMPSESYIDLETEQGMETIKKITQDKNLIYQNEYCTPFEEKVIFLEYLL